MTKTCSKCKIELPKSMFYKDKRTKDGLYYYCKKCVLRLYPHKSTKYYKDYASAHLKKFNKDFVGHVVVLWWKMTSRCRNSKSMIKKGVQKLITREEFMSFFLNSKVYKKLFDEWVANDYNKRLTPSIDRIDSNGHYEIKNMQIITYIENVRKK